MENTATVVSNLFSDASGTLTPIILSVAGAAITLGLLVFGIKYGWRFFRGQAKG
jgi:hypothetical protein